MMLETLGLRAGEAVRFRRPDRHRWQDGVAVGVERDGSLAVRDRQGAARAVPLEGVLVQVRTGRTRPSRWEPLTDRAARVEQLLLF